MAGSLTPGQAERLFDHLPGDVTFVDEHDIVRYYSDPKVRIFSRTPDILGQTVQSCHKPETGPAVNRILDAFRAGRESVVDLPATKDGRPIFVRYVAVRDAAGTYRGCLEIAIDPAVVAVPPK